MEDFAIFELIFLGHFLKKIVHLEMQKSNNNLSKDFFDFDIYKIDETHASLQVNNKKIVVITTPIEAQSQQFLQKILTAVQLDLAKDVLLCQQPVLYKQLDSATTIQSIVVFGYTPNDISLHVDIKPYQIIQFKSKRLLFVHDLDQIAADIDKKKMLWQQLQILFKK